MILNHNHQHHSTRHQQYYQYHLQSFLVLVTFNKMSNHLKYNSTIMMVSTTTNILKFYNFTIVKQVQCTKDCKTLKHYIH